MSRDECNCAANLTDPVHLASCPMARPRTVSRDTPRPGIPEVEAMMRIPTVDTPRPTDDHAAQCPTCEGPCRVVVPAPTAPRERETPKLHFTPEWSAKMADAEGEQEVGAGPRAPHVPCVLCGAPMPPGEEMFQYHGYSGPCPKPPIPRAAPFGLTENHVKALNDQLASLKSPAPVPPVAEARENLLDRLEALVRAEKTAGGPSAANSPLLAAHDFRCSLDALCAAVRLEERAAIKSRCPNCGGKSE